MSFFGMVIVAVSFVVLLSISALLSEAYQSQAIASTYQNSSVLIQLATYAQFSQHFSYGILNYTATASGYYIKNLPGEYIIEARNGRYYLIVAR